MPSFRQFVIGSAGVAIIAILTYKRDQLSRWLHSTSRTQHLREHEMSCDEGWDFNWDKMESLEGADTATTSTANRTLILVRHGHFASDPQTKYMQEGKLFLNELGGQQFLTELGRKQADLAGQQLRALGHSYTTLHYSTTPRAVETAHILQSSLVDVVKDTHGCDLLRKRDLMALPDSESKSSHRDINPRLEAAFRMYFHRAPPSQTKDTVEILVCHTPSIHYFVCRALQLPPNAWRHIMRPAHASITEVVCHPDGRATLKCLGSSGHLPPNAVTYHKQKQQVKSHNSSA